MKIPDNRTEKAIQSAGVRVLRQLGFKVWNLSQARASNQTAGIADTYVTGHGVCAWIEFKRPTGKWSVVQRHFAGCVMSNGGHYIVARSEADVIEWAEHHVNRPRPARAWNP